MNTSSQVVELLKKNGPMREWQISAEVGVGCDATLNRLVKQGCIKAFKDHNNHPTPGVKRHRYIATYYKYVKDFEPRTPKAIESELKKEIAELKRENIACHTTIGNLAAVIRDTLETLKKAAEQEKGPINDTIWVSGYPSATLFDYLEGALFNAESPVDLPGLWRYGFNGEHFGLMEDGPYVLLGQVGAILCANRVLPPLVEVEEGFLGLSAQFEGVGYVPAKRN